MTDDNSTLPCLDDRLWMGRNKCDELPISTILIISVLVSWGVFLVLGGIRLQYLMNSSAVDTDVAKKMQFFQSWFYSLVFTLVNLFSVFLIAEMFIVGEVIAGILLIVFLLFSLAYASQVDVIGTEGKSQGVNNIDFTVMLQLFLSTYLAKAVWKMTGHKETSSSSDAKRQMSGIEKFCCWQEMDNSYRPKVYDFKDIVGIQGAFLSIPSLLTLGIFVGVYCTSIDATFLVIPLCVSALLTPLLGDWETFEKNKLYCVLSVFFRALELSFKVLTYAYFILYSKYAALLVLFFEVMFMWFTTVNDREVSAAGRTGTLSHKIYASWESVFFTRFRRVHVDKEFMVQNSSLMPMTIELLRFIGKVVFVALNALVVYLVIISELKRRGEEMWDDEKYDSYCVYDKWLSYIVFVGGPLWFILLCIYFCCVNRKELKKEDLVKLKTYWMTLQPCKFFFSPREVYLNRDNINYHEGGHPIYV